MKKFRKLVAIVLSLCFMLPIISICNFKTEATDRDTVMECWISDSGMGTNVEYAITQYDGYYYLCYKIFDRHTGSYFSNYAGGTNYSVRMTIYNPYGVVLGSHTYDNSDNNWFGAKFTTAGTYHFKVEVFGDITGDMEFDLQCKNSNLTLDAWTSKTPMGEKEEYFDKEASSYLCYKMYDDNTGVLVDKLLPSVTYTVSLGVYTSDNSYCGGVNYDNRSNGWIRCDDVPERATYKGKVKFSGGINAEMETKFHYKYYTADEMYSFSNSSYDFFGSWNATGTYTMLDSHFNTLSSHIRSRFIFKETENNYIAKMTTKRNSSWAGSCYGMSVTTILDKYNYIGMNENFGSASTISRISRPVSNHTARSAINYYHISQSLGFTRSEKSYNKLNWSSGLKALVNNVKNNDLTLLNFFWVDPDEGDVGHSIVLQYTYVDDNGNHIILAYDPSNLGETTVLKIDKNYKTCKFGDWTSNATDFSFTSDFSKLNRIDIDGSSNVYRSVGATTYSSDDVNTVISFSDADKLIIINEEGESLTYSDFEFSGNMNVLSENRTILGDNSVEFNIEVEDSASYTFITEDNELKVSVLNENIFALAETKNADAVVIAENEGVYIEGDNAECSISITDGKKAEMYQLSPKGKIKDSATFLLADNGICVYGVDIPCQVKAYYDDFNKYKNFIVDTDMKNFKISSDGSTSGTFSIYGSSDDKNFDVAIESKNYISPEKIEISEDKASVELGETLNLICEVFPVDTDDKTVVWFAEDPSIATVENGKVSAVGVGVTKIYVYSTIDNTLFDECSLTVSAPNVSGIEVDKSSLVLKQGEFETVTATVLPLEAENREIRWETLDSSIVSVDSEGLVTAVGVGSTKVYAYTLEGEFKVEIDVVVKPVSVNGVFIVNYEDSNLMVGEKCILEASVSPFNATNKSVNWSSSNEKIAVVNQQGEVTAVSPGDVSITVTTEDGGFIATYDLYISEAKSNDDCSCKCHKSGIAKFFFNIGLFFQKIFKKNKVCKCGVYHY